MPVRRAHLDRLGRLATIAQGSARAASGRLSGLKQIIHVSDLLLVEPLSGGPDLHPRFPKPRKPTLKAPLPQGGAFAFTVVRMRHVGGRGPVPELTSMADIKLNARLSLRTAQTSLAWPQSRRLAAPSMACVLCDQGSLRALEAAPPPQDKGHAGVTPHGLMPGLSSSSQDSVAAKTTAKQSNRSHSQRSPPG